MNSRRIPIALLTTAFVLVIVASAVPWATESGRTAIGISSADPIARFAYYLIWLVAFGAVAATIVDRRRRSAWFGAAAGAIATLILLILPPLLHPESLIPHGQPVVAGTVAASTITTIERGPGSYALIVAVITVVAALITAVRPGRPTARPPAAVAALIGVYAIVAIADTLPWLKATPTQPLLSTSLFGPDATFGPTDLFGAAGAAYYLVWLVFFAAAGALICSRRPRRMLFGAAGGAILTQIPVIAGLLHDPRSFYTSALILVQYPTTELATGAYVVMFGLFAAAAALAFTVGERAWPKHVRRPVATAIVVIGVGLAGAAQVTPWVASWDGGYWYGTPYLTISTGGGVPAFAFVIAWLITLVAAGAALLATGRSRRLLTGVAAGGIATLLFIVVPFLLWPGSTVPPVLVGRDITVHEAGGGLELCAIIIVAVGALSGFRRYRRIAFGPMLLATIGVVMAITAQSMHWFRLARTYTVVGAPTGQSFPATVAIWASGSPARSYAPMIAGWIVIFTAVGTVVLTDGRIRRRFTVIAAAALALETLAITAFLIHPAIPVAGSIAVGRPLKVATEHIDYSRGTFLAYAAVLVFAACLVLVGAPRRRPSPVRRPAPEPAVEPEVAISPRVRPAVEA